jgi:NAD(P)-dependent dehydrogenase (short-subunit alcohol dehydrogenase family)
MNNKTCLITGATDGIGYMTAQALAQQGATVIIVGRNQNKCETTVSNIKQQTGNHNVEYMVADLSSIKDIYRLAPEFLSRHQRLDVLVNNVGAIFMSRQESVDGLEMTFALNHVSYFLVTHLLLDMLRASAPARIVNVSSMAHKYTKINFDNLQGQRKYSGMEIYSQSKLANILFTYELARRLEGTGITANALHPGVVSSNFAMNNGFQGRVMRKAMDVASINVTEGAQTSVYLATSPEVEGITGKYFDNCKPVPSSKYSYDVEAARRLWDISITMTGLPS